MRDILYLGSRTGEYIGDSNDVHIVTDADWTAAAEAALARGADPTAVSEAVANRAVSGSDLLGMSAVGDVQRISGIPRLKQDITKILLTERGLNPYPNYGTILPGLVGTRLNNPDTLSLVANEVISALRYQYLIETSQDLDEIIGQVRQLDVEFSSNSILITLQVETASKAQVALQFEV